MPLNLPNLLTWLRIIAENEPAFREQAERVTRRVKFSETTANGYLVDQFIESLTPELRAVFDDEFRKANEYFKTAPAEMYDIGSRPPRPPQ